MNIISEFALSDTAKELEDITPLGEALKKITHEVCHAYDLRVYKVQKGYKSFSRLITPDGIPCGHVSVEKSNGSNDITYYIALPTIRKERSGAKSGRGERESNKISSLLRAIKKNKEEPTKQALYDSMKRDYLSPFDVIRSKSRWGAPSISVPSNIQEVMAKYVLGVDTHSMSMYIDELQKIYSEHQSKMKSHNESAKDFTRFRKNATLIGAFTKHNLENPYYLVADVSCTDGDEFTFHTPLKRYSTLKELPIAPVVAMIHTYMQGRPEYDRNNELGVWFHDHFYDDLDISVGYSGSNNGLWVAIPHEAP